MCRKAKIGLPCGKWRLNLTSQGLCMHIYLISLCGKVVLSVDKSNVIDLADWKIF